MLPASQWWKMYNDPEDKSMLGTDRRLVEWLIQFIRSFSEDESKFKETASEIAGSQRFDERKRAAISVGVFSIRDVISHFAHSVHSEDTFSGPLRFHRAFVNRLHDFELSGDVRAFLDITEFDVFLSKEVIGTYSRLGCLDNAILGLHHILEKYERSVCHIEVRNVAGDTFGGTGFISAIERADGSPRHCILTNRHVVDPSKWEIRRVQIPGGELQFGELFVSDKDDIAALELTDSPVSHPFNLYPHATRLEKVVTLGYPYVALAKQPVFMAHAGEVNGFTDTIDNRTLMLISADVGPGSSGGPVLNQLGLVIGVTTQSQEGTYIIESESGDAPQNRKTGPSDLLRSVYHAAIPAPRVLEFFRHEVIGTIREGG